MSIILVYLKNEKEDNEQHTTTSLCQLSIGLLKAMTCHRCQTQETKKIMKDTVEDKGR